MNTENTIDILRKLNKAELKRFGDFIRSPYFNSAEKLIKFYDLLIKTYPDFNEDKLSSEYVYKKIFPGKEFKLQAVKNLYWEFGVLLTQFLAYEEFSSKENLVELNLVEALRKRKNYDLSKKRIRDYKKKGYNKAKENEKVYNEDDLYLSYKMERENRHNIIHSRPLVKQDVFDSLNSESEIFILLTLNMFHSLAYTLSLTSITKADEDNNKKIKEFLSLFNFEKLLKHFKTSTHLYAPAIRLRYLFYYYTAADISHEQYLELKKLLIDNVHNFSKEDLLEFFKAIIEIILLKLSDINEKYLNEAFELRKLFCELKIYPDSSIPAFSPAMFQNSLIIATLLKEFEWAENFIEEYINYIDEDLRENEYNYSKGLLCFKQKKYQESLEYLNKVKYSKILEKVNVRFYYVMNYIELKLYDAAASMIKSIKQFHRESKDIREFDSPPINYSIAFFSEIIKCSENNTKIDHAVYMEACNAELFYHSGYIIQKFRSMM